MCGRLNVADEPFTQQVCSILGIPFSAVANSDLRPSQSVSVVSSTQLMDTSANSINDPIVAKLVQQSLSWGIKPYWAKRLIINAQAETVAVKPTFKSAFLNQRVLVPCTGWYEWCGDKGNKQKYLFTHPDKQPLFMAGIAIGNQLITLTTKPNRQYANYHHRMPLLVPDDALNQWIAAKPALAALLLNNETEFDLTAEVYGV